jgi:hypothetical protein
MTALVTGVGGFSRSHLADARLVDEVVGGCDVVYHVAALIGIPYS